MNIKVLPWALCFVGIWGMTLTTAVAQTDLARLEALIQRQEQMIQAQEARLQELEKQNTALKAMMESLVATTNHTPNVGTAISAVTTSDATNAVTRLGEYLAFTKPNGITIVPYGYLKFDAVYDSARTAFGDASVYAYPRSVSGGNRKDLTFSAREARLGFAITMPENTRLKVTGRLEGDFYGDLANQDSYQLRLRLAWLNAAWGEGWSIRLGQDWDTFVSIHPRMLDAGILAGTGHVWGRRPQVRLTKVTELNDKTRLIAKLALENGYKNDVDGDSQQDSNAAGIPQSVAQLALETRLWGQRDTLLALSGLYGEERTRREPHPGDYHVELAHLALQLPLIEAFTLQGTLWYGRNLDAYYGGVMQGINLTRGRSIATHGAWFQGVYDINERLAAGLGYGFDNPSNSDLSLATARTFNERYFASLFYKLTDNLMLGCEYATLHTEFKEERSVRDHRFQVSGQLNF